MPAYFERRRGLEVGQRPPGEPGQAWAADRARACTSERPRHGRSAGGDGRHVADRGPHRGLSRSGHQVLWPDPDLDPSGSWAAAPRREPFWPRCASSSTISRSWQPTSQTKRLQLSRPRQAGESARSRKPRLRHRLYRDPIHEPVVERAWIRPGTHINAMGADGHGKQELDPRFSGRPGGRG